MLCGHTPEQEGPVLVESQEIVYSGTWHLAPSKPPGKPTPATSDLACDSPFKCEFDGLVMPIIDWQVSGPERIPVRVVVSDDPDFFGLLAESDRQFLLQIFANVILDLLRSDQTRRQFGFVVRATDQQSTQSVRYVEYNVALIRTDFRDGKGGSRFIANIWSGPPPKRLRQRRTKPDK